MTVLLLNHFPSAFYVSILRQDLAKLAEYGFNLDPPALASQVPRTTGMHQCTKQEVLMVSASVSGCVEERGRLQW